jgi:c(7)-type cytochrome triheme protein
MTRLARHSPPEQGGHPVSFQRLASVALVVAVGLVALAVPSGAQVKVPADFAFEQGKDSPGVVTFSHEKHKAKVEKCQACHTKVFKMKKGTSEKPTMAKMASGESCGTCHNGKTEIGGAVVFNAQDKPKCETCHRK